MAADTYAIPGFAEPALLSRNSPIVRSARVDLASLVGAAGGTIASDLLEQNDVVKFFKLPPDVKLLWARVDSEDLDSSTTLVWDLSVTNGTTTKYLFQSGTIGQSAGFVDTRDADGTGVLNKFSTNAGVGFVTDNDNYWVQYKCTTAPTGAGSGDEIIVEVAYTSQLESGEAGFRT